MAAKFINITQVNSPTIQADFSEKISNSNLGPLPLLSQGTSLESNAIQPIAPVNAAVWSPMTSFEQGLKDALVNWIDTTMENVKYPKDFGGRKKIMDFFYSGTATKSMFPGEIGHFQLIFSYPPNITNTNSTTTTTNSTL
jgi:hypothetical protein